MHFIPEEKIIKIDNTKARQKAFLSNNMSIKHKKKTKNKGKPNNKVHQTFPQPHSSNDTTASPF